VVFFLLNLISDEEKLKISFEGIIVERKFFAEFFLKRIFLENNFLLLLEKSLSNEGSFFAEFFWGKSQEQIRMIPNPEFSLSSN